MLDIDAEAVELSKKNCLINNIPGVKVIQSKGLSSLDEKGFTIILSNPPYHADFAVPKAFIEKGFNRLSIGGRMYMVTKRKDWYKNKLESIFGGVKLWEIDGYFVFMAIKKTNTYANTKKKPGPSR
jgi:16S rRNA (guanine1207-N2)-methyltransferase